MAETETNFQTNLRLLVRFEHGTGREAAKVLGVQERTVSQWLTGKRYPSGEMLMRIDKTYGISPRALDLPPEDFAQLLTDRERLDKFSMAIHSERAKEIESRRVVPINRRQPAGGQHGRRSD
jgi:transcriptional regulator with XRE-family HTH domain